VRIAEVSDVASVATELTAGLRARGHDVRFIQPRMAGAGLPGVVKPVVAPWRFMEWVAIAREIRRGGFDAVHIHHAYMGMIGVLGRFPYVLHCRGDDLRDLDHRVRRPFITVALRRAAYVYYAPPDLRERLQALRPDAEFLPNPVDTTVFRPRPANPEGPDVFVACALTENKGVANILEACRLLTESRPNIRITATAGGDATRAFDALPQVTLITHQPRAKLAEIMGRHRVIVGQTHQGAIGMTELEAMACARPVVAHFSHDDAYSEPPPLVRATSAVEIASGVAKYLDDAAAAHDLGCLARAWIERHHDVRVISARLEERLLQLAAR
jgi:glycosyltransferase involved in cell wall biosynthesis